MKPERIETADQSAADARLEMALAYFDRFTSTCLIDLEFEIDPRMARKVQEWIDLRDWPDEPQLERLGRVHGSPLNRYGLTLRSCDRCHFEARWMGDFEVRTV